MKDQFGNEMNNDVVNSNEETNTVYQDKDTDYQDRDGVYQGRDTVNQGSDTAYQDGYTADQDGDTADQDSGVLTDRDRSNQDTALVGVFNTENEAINVIHQLKEIGYQEDEITVLAKDKDKMDRIDDVTEVHTKTQDDGGRVGSGAAIGGALGGIAAAFPALGLLAIPGIGPILAAGPIAVILGGALAGGVAGGLVGALSELGVKEDDAKEYGLHIDQGKIIVLVENKNDLKNEVYKIYEQNNSVFE